MIKYLINSPLIIFVVISLFFTSQTATSAAHSLAAYKHFSDYIDIQPTKGSDPKNLRAHFTAKQKINDRIDEPAFKKNSWKLVMRRGIYLAEVEKTMSEIYAYFLGYATDIDLVEENGDYYAARRKFRHFKVFEKQERKNPYLIRQDGNSYYVEDYLLQEDGSLIKGNQIKHFSGLAKIAVLTRFFAESDAEPFNYGIQEIGNDLRAIHFDNEHALTFGEDADYPDIENDLAQMLGEKFIQMTWFQREKREMLEKIAHTDFAVIERIIRKNITVSQLEQGKWLLNKILRDPTIMPNYDRNLAKKQLEELNRMDESKYGVEQMIRVLRDRQQQLREQLRKRDDLK